MTEQELLDKLEHRALVNHNLMHPDKEDVYLTSGSKISQKSLMKYIMQKKDAELSEYERERIRRGYCPLCNMALTEQGDCQNALCPNSVKERKKFTVEQSRLRGIKFEMDHIKTVQKNCLTEFINNLKEDDVVNVYF